MKTTSKIAYKIAQFFLALYFSLRLYYLWSSVHRFLFDRKWKDVELPKFRTIRHVAAQMATFKWKADGITELWDAVCTPQKVQAVGFNGSSPHGNDCDEEAIWNTNVILNSLPFEEQENDFHKGLKNAEFFTVTWYELQGRFSGHNVCLLTYEDGYRYMDYYLPSAKFSSIDEVANLVISKYAGWDTTGHGTQPAIRLVWCRSNKDLKPVEVKVG